ncbi:MFS transporter [Gluconacetobacter tumulicola]|uniref:MFS transporter n=1 Tax=Gluconacetobacter tumulicola TaxID=1017177 RepID=A0A7W4JEH3_9PROT|nr:MFS transporter [Gluconacetobacter tumulicola]MBB2179791.1 MFS transporter [Gluconacetobacter tumulicola]
MNPTSASSRRNIVGAAVGNAFELFDFTAYATFATVISHIFFPAGHNDTALLLTLATFGIGFLVRPLGAFLIGAYADRYGRRAAMTLTVWVMAAGSAIIAFLPGYASIGVLAPLALVVARLLQGFAAGGELGAATSILVESAREERMGLAGSWQTTGQHLGALISGLLGLILFLGFDEHTIRDWAWRLPFVFGMLIAPVGIYLRKTLEETVPSEEERLSFADFLRQFHNHAFRRLPIGIVYEAGSTIQQYFFQFVVTYAVHTLHMPIRKALLINISNGLVGFAGSVAGGLLADRYGARRVIVISRLVNAALYFPVFWLMLQAPSLESLTLACAVLMIGNAISGGAGMAFLASLFPRDQRAFGIGLSYSIGVTLFGSTAQLVFAWIIGVTGGRLSWIGYVIAVCVLSAVILMTAQRVTNMHITSKKKARAV